MATVDVCQPFHYTSCDTPASDDTLRERGCDVIRSPDSLVSPAERKEFTIYADDDEDLSLRAPSTQLARLEASEGFVTLHSKPCPSDNCDSDSGEELPGCPTNSRTTETREVQTMADQCVEDNTDQFSSSVTIAIQTDEVDEEELFYSVTCREADLTGEGQMASTPRVEICDRGPVIATHTNSYPPNQDRPVSANSKNSSSSDPVVSAAPTPTLKVEYVGKVWDAYINDFLLGSDHIKDAAIYDKATCRLISCSTGFAISDDEFHHLLQCINCLKLAYSKEGIHVGQKRYTTVLADGRRGLMAKGAEQSGLSACQSRTLVIIALHDRTGKARKCNEELMRLGDFFWTKGL